MLPKLRVGHSPIWGAGLLLIAALDLVLAVMSDRNVMFIFAGMLALMGISQLLGALLMIDNKTIELKSPLGMTLKTFVVTSADDLRIDGRKLFITVDGVTRKVSGLMAKGADWQALADAIAAAKTASKAKSN